MDGDLSHAESRRGGEFFSRKERIDRKGWKRVRLGDIGEVLRGVSFDGQKDIRPQNSAQSVAIFRSNNIQDATINHSDLIYVRKSRVNQLQLMRSNDILICMANGSKKLVGKSALFKGAKQEFSFGAFMGVFRCFNETMASFFAYLLLTNQYREYIDVLLSGSSINNLRPSDIENLEFSIPPSSEQLRIANTLKLCDDHISALQSLIAKYEAIKKATVNLLLKPKVGWRQITLSDIGAVLMCKRILKNQTTETGDVPFYKIGTFGKTPDSFISRSLFEDFKARFSYPNKGDVLLSAAGTIGRTVVFNGEDAYFQDSNIVWIDNNESIVTNRFLNVLYGQMDWQTENGGTVSRLYNANIRNTRISIPTLTEQKRIVGILDSIDGTINGLKSQLAKAKDIKQGMMSYFFG